jgi:pimeloyl-ACP methyl ester carboxylesterase
MRVLVDDVHLFFDVEGPQLVPEGPRMRERPTLLLLHGGPGFDHSLFKPAFSTFRERFQVIYLDHRGHGRSDRGPVDRWMLAQWADDVRKFCEVLHIDRPIVFGASFGGIVAQAYATRYPDHPRALVLCSTTPRFRLDRVLDTFERLGGPRVRQAAAAWFEQPSAETAAAYLRLCLPLYKQSPWDPVVIGRGLTNVGVTMIFVAGEWRTFNFLPVLSRVRCPTLVLSGEADPITPVADGEDLASALSPRLVQFKRFPKCGHPVYEDDEVGCLTTIRDFLANV